MFSLTAQNITEGGEQMRDWMKNARVEKGFTQLQVAEKIGITEGYYSLIENGERMKSLDLTFAKKLAELFGMTVQQVIEKERI